MPRGKTEYASPAFSDDGYLAQLQAHKIWLDGAAAIAHADMLLAQENHANMLLAREHMYLHAVQENARLVQENRMLRMKSQETPHVDAPPGLEAPDLEPPAPLKPSKPSKNLRPHAISDVSTCASSNPSAWATASAATSSWNMTAAPSMASSFGMASCPPGSWNLETLRESEPLTESAPPGSWTFDPTTSVPPGSWKVSDCAKKDTKAPEETEQAELEPGSSVMMRNLPNDYTRSMLLELLKNEGFAEKYDFVYLPIDFRSGSGLGYAFINFLSLEIAEDFRAHFGGFNRWSVKSDKTCNVTWSSIQGLDAHIERFRNSPVMHESVPEDQKPILFGGSEQIKFPEPTKKIREPRHWHRRR